MLNKAQLRPIRYAPLIRVGPAQDGGYVVPADQLSGCGLLLSLGLNDDWSFDREFVARNPRLRVIGVDHTVGPALFARRLLRSLLKLPGYAVIRHREKIDHYRRWLRVSFDYFRFFRGRHHHLRKMVGTRDDDVGVTLATLIRMADSVDATAPPDIFLKMDIEGSEYDCLDDILRHAGRIRCIAAEFHHLDTRTDDFNRAIAALAQHFHLVHIHGNNFSRFDTRTQFPSAVEITWVNKSLVAEPVSPSALGYPVTGLDFPNDSHAPDHPLSFGQEPARK